MFRRGLSKLRPAQTVVIGYFAYAVLGWLILLLPVCHKKSVSVLDNLFTAMSAISTTGLTTVDVGSVYSFFGQIVILLLIQIGGVGYMTFITFIYMALRNKLHGVTKKFASATFSLPKNFHIRQFIIHVVVFSLVCELIGAIALSAIFNAHGIENPVWNGIFHGVSAFCTAGFSLFSDSFVRFSDDLWINLTMGALSISSGSLGFIVWLDLYKTMTGERKRVLFTSKVVMVFGLGFIFLGTALFFFLESLRQNGFSLHETILTSFFQVMTAATTVGYNTLDIGKLSHASILLLFFLMFFGTSPAGTGGGLKNTTFAALVALVKSALQGKRVVTLWRHEIGIKTIRLATASFAFYMFVILVAVFLLDFTEKTKHFLPLLFESVSAMGTVGLSMGITSDLSAWGKGIICLLMLMGRAGVLTFAIAISSEERKEAPYIKEVELII